MNEPASTKAAREWGNCPKCGYFYKQQKLDECPMCHHAWRIPVGYNQPPYEKPGLE